MAQVRILPDNVVNKIAAGGRQGTALAVPKRRGKKERALAPGGKHLSS